MRDSRIHRDDQIQIHDEGGCIGKVMTGLHVIDQLHGNCIRWSVFLEIEESDSFHLQQWQQRGNWYGALFIDKSKIGKYPAGLP